MGQRTCPQGQCGEVAQKAIDELFGGASVLNKEVRCKTLTDALKEIEENLIEKALIIIWVKTGFYDGNPLCFAYHTYIVYDAQPLSSFSIWKEGLQFYDEKDTEAAIEKSTERGNVITIHQHIKV